MRILRFMAAGFLISLAFQVPDNWGGIFMVVGLYLIFKDVKI